MKKIDIFLNGAYLCSTSQSRTCKEAKEKIINKKRVFIAGLPNKIVEIKDGDKVTAFYSK